MSKVTNVNSQKQGTERKAVNRVTNVNTTTSTNINTTSTNVNTPPATDINPLQPMGRDTKKLFKRKIAGVMSDDGDESNKGADLPHVESNRIFAYGEESPLPNRDEQVHGDMDIRPIESTVASVGRPAMITKIPYMGKRKIPVLSEVEIYVDGVRWFTARQMMYILGISVSAFYYRVNVNQIDKISVGGLSLYR